MNNKEAKKVLTETIKVYRDKALTELLELVEEKFKLEKTYYKEVELENGNWYQVRVNVFWDDKKTKTLRIVGSIDDGGLRAMVPITDGFIISSNGKFVGE